MSLHNVKRVHSRRQTVSSIDYYAYLSKLNKLNSGYKIILGLITLILCIVYNNMWVSLIVMGVMSFLTVVVGGLPLIKYISLLTIPITFMLLSGIPIALDIGIIKTLLIMLRAFGAITAMYMVTLSTPSVEIISSMRKAYIPNIIVELMYMIYRFIFILMDIQNNMKNAASSRLGYANFKTSCRSFGMIGSNLMIVAMKKANVYYDAMESRCYEGKLNFLEEKKPVKLVQVLGGLCFIGILTVVKILT